MRLILTLLCCLLVGNATAAHEPLPVDQVFKPSVSVTQFNQLRVSWQLTPHVSIYKNSLHFAVMPKNTVILSPKFPPTDGEKLGP